MLDDELFRQLKESGFETGPSVVRTDGVMLYQVNRIFMFRQDAVDLAQGQATVAQVLARNKGKVFPQAPEP